MQQTTGSLQKRGNALKYPVIGDRMTMTVNEKYTAKKYDADRKHHACPEYTPYKRLNIRILIFHFGHLSLVIGHWQGGYPKAFIKPRQYNISSLDFWFLYLDSNFISSLLSRYISFARLKRLQQWQTPISATPMNLYEP